MPRIPRILRLRDLADFVPAPVLASFSIGNPLVRQRLSGKFAGLTTDAAANERRKCIQENRHESRPSVHSVSSGHFHEKHPEQGHFGLAVQDYTHSTAPNRRFADLVTQRLIKAVLGSQPAPYSDDELAAIALNCTVKEDAARKVEREMSKRIAAVAMSSRIGETFDAVVTGVTTHGTFVRVLKPAVEGLLAQGQQGADVGDKLRVKLTRTDIQRGYIDFVRD